MSSSTPTHKKTSTNESLLRSEEMSSDMENNNNDSAGDNMAHEPSYENLDKDDPATTQAREDLKHTTISDKEPLEGSEMTGMDLLAHDAPEVPRAEAMTPEPLEPSDAQDAEMKERISSPKKKRGREQDDEARDSEAATKPEEAGTSPNGTLNGGRTTRLEPEKKRHRDISADISAAVEGSKEGDPVQDISPEPKATKGSKSDTTEKSPDLAPRTVFGSTLSDKYQTSPSAFAASGFGSLVASSASGFATLAASKPTVFGSVVKPPLSGFGALVASAKTTENSAVKPSFGGLATDASKSTLGPGFGIASKSGFGVLGSGFGSGFGGFTSGSGPKLSSFASANKPAIIGAEKPTRAFGAPESDEDEVSEDGEDESGSGASDDEEKISPDDKKKQKVSKIPLVPVNDGEEGEATLLQFRVKLYTLESKETGWKERGVGTLKLNVPSPYVDYDINGVPLLGTFDPSVGEEDESGPKVARLIMRQEHTLRVILNTPILKGLKFEEKPASSTAQILFTAFEDGKPVNMLMKMSETNSRLFISEVISIQKELGS